MNAEESVVFLKWFVEWGEGITKELHNGPWWAWEEGIEGYISSPEEKYMLGGEHHEGYFNPDEPITKFICVSRSLVPGMVEATKPIIKLYADSYGSNVALYEFSCAMIIRVAKAYRRAVEDAGVKVPE